MLRLLLKPPRDGLQAGRPLLPLPLMLPLPMVPRPLPLPMLLPLPLMLPLPLLRKLVCALRNAAASCSGLYRRNRRVDGCCLLKSTAAVATVTSVRSVMQCVFWLLVR